MNFNIDIAIFVGFLIINLVLGLMASRGVNTIRSFAVGDKNFTTATLAFTITSIWVSGEFFFTIVAESYKDGLLFISILIANFLAYLSVGLLFAPRLGEFLNKISIAEAMGSLYGKKVRSITAISGVIGIVGIVAIQLQIAGVLFEYIIGTEKFYGVIISGIIITLYSSFGGIKSVTFTDIIQFCTFGIIIPVIAYFLLKNTCDPRLVFSTISQNPKFNFSSSFSFSNPEIYYYISLFLWLLIPHFNPAIFQRIAMAKNVKQVRDSFIIASFAGLILAALTCWIGILVLFNNPDIPEGDILRYTIVNYSWISGFNGMIAAGVMAMIMSTVDSHINSNSILLVHDLSHSLNVNLDKKELPYTRVCSLMIGAASILMALRGGNFFELIIWTSTFYMPVVTVPFIVSVFGFRSSGSSVLAGMGSGFAVVVIWEIFLKEHMAGVGGLIPGMFANLIVLFAYHHLFNQKGGWVEIKHVNELTNSKKQTMKEKLANIWTNITSFDLLLSFKKNMPNNARLTALFGVFLIISMFFSINTIPKAVHQNFSFLLDILYLTTASAATLLMGYPLYAQKCLKRDVAAIVWNAIIFFVLICFSFLIVLMSNFSEVQLMVFMMNIMMISSLISWRYSLFYSLFGVAITVFVYEKFLIKYQTIGEISSLEFKIAYLALLIASVFVTFIKPSQEEGEMAKKKVEILETEKKSLGKELLNLKDENGKYKKEISTLNQAVTHYSERASDQAKEIERLAATAQKILNNVNHELRLPVGNVMNFSQMICEGLDKYTPDQLKDLSDEVYKNSTRLSTMILNMLDLATLDVKKVNLNKSTENFSELVRDRVKVCRNMYLQGKPIKFKLTIEPEILIPIDPNYIRQVVDNLTINAINFSQKGMIEVEVRRQGDKVVMMMRDEGIGIPKHELFDIFDPFRMGSNTATKAEGRGVGLALCKSAVEAHDGIITAESPEGKGAVFYVVLPIDGSLN